MKNTYYQDELRYLREVAPEFAHAHPEVARMLADRGADPDVERLLEGVAFLCARVRQKLDDELPELTASMMSLLWPHYLRPVPSMSILEILPEIDQMQAPYLVRHGAEFASVQIDGTSCRFRSAWPMPLRPWVLRDVRLESAAAKPWKLLLTLQGSPKSKLEKLDLSSVRFHLAGDAATSFALYLLVAGHVDHATVSDGSSRHNRPEALLAPQQIAPAGLTRDEAVLPYPARSFAGYRLLQEYFAFKERFLFFDIRGLDRCVRKLGLNDTVEVAMTFNRRLDTTPMVSRDNVRLHCVPIINLFQHPADPIRIAQDRVQYLVQPSRTGIADRRHAEVYSIDSVIGLDASTKLDPREYKPFYSFSHLMASEPKKAAYYQTHMVPNILADDPRFGTDTFISFVSSGAVSELPAEETMSIELTCTNRDLAANLRAGDICEPTDSSPPSARFRNLVRPSPTIAPPLGKALHWRLISHMALNYVTLSDARHFKELLRIYDFQAEHDAQRASAQQRLLDGIVKLRSSFAERMVRGSPIRGTQVDLELNEDHFAGEGDAYLFATVLERFMSLYVTLNGYTQLSARFTRSGQVYRFPARWGEQFTPADARNDASES